MNSVLGIISKQTYQKSSAKLISSYYLLSRRLFQVDWNNVKLHNYSSMPVNVCYPYNSLLCNVKYTLCSPVAVKRHFSKKKGSKRSIEEEESDSDNEEDYEELDAADDLGNNVITKSVPSLRIDSILKYGLGRTKKKIEQDFYAAKLRINGQRVLKKALPVYVGDEIDLVKGFSPDTSKFLIVDRVIIRGVDKLTGTGMYPVKFEVLKGLVIENYEEPWTPDSLGQLEK